MDNSPKRSVPNAALIALSLSACVHSAQSSSDAAAIDTFRTDLPYYSEDLAAGVSPVRIESSGELTFKGRPITAAAVSSTEARVALEEEERTLVQIDGEAGFADALARLAALSEQTLIDIVGLRDHKDFERADAKNGDVISDQRFQGPVDEYELPVLVGYSVPTKACVVSWVYKGSPGDKAVPFGFTQLYNSSFNVLDHLVQREGGPEVMMGNPEKIDRVIARIQAPSRTPWRCIAGAVYAIKTSGWPTVQFEVSDK